MEDRFEARARNKNGAWVVFDKERKCAVLQSVSPNASYNQEFATKVAYLMNVTGKHLDFSK